MNVATSPEARLRVVLRPTAASDLPALFQHQLDPEANRMAALAAKDPGDGTMFMAHWEKILDGEGMIVRSILLDEQIAGYLAHFPQFGKSSVCYWIGREYWGRGIATEAHRQFLRHVTMRPLYARAAQDNLGSLRVLEKCGFTICSEDSGFSYARGKDVEESILELAGQAAAPSVVCSAQTD